MEIPSKKHIQAVCEIKVKIIRTSLLCDLYNFSYILTYLLCTAVVNSKVKVNVDLNSTS